MTHRKPRLFLVLGDQLHPDPHPLLSQVTDRDYVLMAEVVEESTHVWSHKARIGLFLSAMRHFAARWKARCRLTYLQIGRHAFRSIPEAVEAFVGQHPDIDRICVLEPGDARLLDALLPCCARMNRPVDLVADPHFLCSREDFETWANRGASNLRMEFFYRWMRRRTGVLMQDDQPIGGQWNFDAENRSGFGAGGPPPIPAPQRFPPDPLTCEVLDDVEQYFAQHPGSIETFAWPLTTEDAQRALDDFIQNRLPAFGQWQDAMWQGEPFLWHSLISAALNLKLLDPREVIARAEAAWREGVAPLPAVEGFIRQILGWREFVRGIYWRHVEAWPTTNVLHATRPLPSWFWSGQTSAACLKAAIGKTLQYGYAHHIQRLMVTGNFALLAGLQPRQVADWYLAVYVDAIAWVEEPNTLGMALFALGGRMTSKPYIASGAYIKRMSNYCKGCAYRPDVRTGPGACPYTTLYWDFLMRHEATLRANPRMAMAYKNLDRMDESALQAIRAWAVVRLEQIESL